MNKPTFTDTTASQPIMEVIVSIGCMDSEKFYVSGTGVIIAPHLAITAKHVIEDLIERITNKPIDKSGKAGESKTDNYQIDILASQYDTGGKKVFIWRVLNVYFSLHTDIALLYLIPSNNESQEYKWRQCKIDLNAPGINDEIFGFGFYNSESILNRIDGRIVLHWNNSGATTTGKVIEVFSQKRDSFRLPFPCFQTNARFDGGMSGGPIFNKNGYLIGLISSTLPADSTFEEHISYVALLWPMMIVKITIPYPELRHLAAYTVLKLAEIKAMHVEGWEKVTISNSRGGEWYDTISFDY